MRAKKVLLILFALAALGGLVLAGVLAVLVPRWVSERVVAAARERGIELVPGDIDFGIGWVRIEASKLRLIGVRSLSADVGTIEAAVVGFVPVRFAVRDVNALALGTPWDVAREIEAWATQRQRHLKEPNSIERVRFALSQRAGAPADVAFEGGKLRVTPEQTLIEGTRLRAYERELGDFRLQRAGRVTRAAFTLGERSLENPALTLDYSDGQARSVHVALAPTSFARLSQLARTPNPFPDVVLSGTLDVQIPSNLIAGGRIQGRSDWTLKGYIPPHPAEIEGFLFGDTTTVTSAFTLEPENLRAVLAPVELVAGRFALRGKGEVLLEGQLARLALRLRGVLPCASLAGAAAETRLGRALGAVSGSAARQVLNGSVGVSVAVDVDSRDLAAPRVLSTILPGCGLRPLSLAELVQLGMLLPDALSPEVARDFQQLMEDNFRALKPPPGVHIVMPKLPELELPQLPPSGRKQLGAGGGSAN